MSRTKEANLYVGEGKVDQIAISKQRAQSWLEFKKICKRDGVSVSSRILDFVTEYVGVHGDGNSQTKLEFASEPLCLPRYKTCEFSDRALHRGTLMCNKEAVRKIPKACDRCSSYRTVKR